MNSMDRTEIPLHKHVAVHVLLHKCSPMYVHVCMYDVCTCMYVDGQVYAGEACSVVLVTYYYMYVGILLLST